MNILQASVGFWRNAWSGDKFLELMPQYPVRRIREAFHVGTTTSSESNVYYRMRGSPPIGLSLLPHQEAMLKVLDHDTYDERYEIEFLGDRFLRLIEPEGA